MSNYLKMKMEDGSELYIETIETGGQGHGNPEEFGNGDIPAMNLEPVKDKVIEAAEFFGKALPVATGFAKRVAEQIRKDVPSDEMELEFSIALTGEAKAAICSGGVETGINVKLKWNKAETKSTQEN